MNSYMESVKLSYCMFNDHNKFKVDFKKIDYAYLATWIDLTLLTPVCVCVCVSLAASYYHTEKFMSCTADKGVGEVRGRERGKEKERVCLRKNNKLPLI